jgi:TonB family protein
MLLDSSSRAFRSITLLVALLSATTAIASESKPVRATLPAMRHYEAPVFPVRLRMTPITQGYATVAYTVDADGKIIDALTLEATHPAFGDAVLEAMSSWILEPAPSTSLPRREITDFMFEREAVTALSHLDSAKAAFSPTLDDAEQVKTVAWDRIDNKPQRIATATPVYPSSEKSTGTATKVAVSFVIDKTGAVRVPTATSNSNSDFADAAVNAVKQWRFTPAQHQGSATQVEVVRNFSFGKGSSQ